jgi:hypothetical protein
MAIGFTCAPLCFSYGDSITALSADEHGGSAMAGKIPLLVLPSKDVPDLTGLIPVKALTDYFSAVGYPLNIRIGEPLAFDPTDHPENIPDFCRSVAPPSGVLPWPGVVLVSDQSVHGSGTNGTLLDMESRGACAVFTGSNGFYDGDNDARFEIFAHEIGHMLNLSHLDANEPYPTAMNQWDYRSSVYNRSDIWIKAIEQGSVLQNRNLPTYFNGGNRSPLGLPMSAACCEWLESAPRELVLPWGSPFKDFVYGGVDDKSFGLIDCQLSIESEGSVAQPIDLKVSISPSQMLESVDIPVTIDMLSGIIEVHITSPVGNTRAYRCKSLTCGSIRQELVRGRVVCRNYSLLADSNGILFPAQGVYRVEAVLPTLGARSGSHNYVVGPAVGPFKKRKFWRFLIHDFPKDDVTGWASVDEALSSNKIPLNTKSFLKYKAAARGHRPFMPMEELRREASARVQERDALLRVVRLRSVSGSSSDDIKQAVDDAEDIFRTTDMWSPSIDYLENIRQKLYK